MSWRGIGFSAAAALLLSTAPVRAQHARLTEVRPIVGPAAEGPVLGFILDRAAQRIRPVLGVPGAAIVGGADEGSSDVSSAVVSPNGDYALALTGARQEAVIWRAGQRRARLEFLPGSPDAVAISPEGSAAAAYY